MIEFQQPYYYKETLRECEAHTLIKCFGNIEKIILTSQGDWEKVLKNPQDITLLKKYAQKVLPSIFVYSYSLLESLYPLISVKDIKHRDTIGAIMSNLVSESIKDGIINFLPVRDNRITEWSNILSDIKNSHLYWFGEKLLKIVECVLEYYLHVSYRLWQRHLQYPEQITAIYYLSNAVNNENIEQVLQDKSIPNKALLKQAMKDIYDSQANSNLIAFKGILQKAKDNPNESVYSINDCYFMLMTADYISTLERNNYWLNSQSKHVVQPDVAIDYVINTGKSVFTHPLMQTPSSFRLVANHILKSLMMDSQLEFKISRNDDKIRATIDFDLTPFDLKGYVKRDKDCIVTNRARIITQSYQTDEACPKLVVELFNFYPILLKF